MFSFNIQIKSKNSNKSSALTNLIQILLHSRISQEKFIIQLFDWNLERSWPWSYTENEEEKSEKLMFLKIKISPKKEARPLGGKPKNAIGKPKYLSLVQHKEVNPDNLITERSNWLLRIFWWSPQAISDSRTYFWQTWTHGGLVQFHRGSSLDVGVTFGQV